MDTRFKPVIKLEINHMKASIIHSLGMHDSEMGDMIDAQVERALAEYDFEGQVTRCVNECVQQAIYEIFHAPEGEGYRRIARSINESIFPDDVDPEKTEN